MFDQEMKRRITEVAVVVAVAVILVATFGLAGCASNVERSYSQCLALGGNASYVEAGDLRKVACSQ